MTQRAKRHSLRGCIYSLCTMPYVLGILYIYGEWGGWYGVFGVPMAIGAVSVALSHMIHPEKN